MTEVFDAPAEREGTFRFLENPAIDADAIGNASFCAAAKRMAGFDRAIVALDGTSLSVKDLGGTKGLGVIGARYVGATGLQVMSALAMTADGTPMGLAGQKLWTRVEPSTVTNPKKDKRPLDQKETRHWLEVTDQVLATFAEHAPQTRPWFQLDRGADAAAVLVEAVGFSDKAWLTVRATYDRRLLDDLDDGRYLRERLEHQAPAAFYGVEIAAGPNRTARTANMQVRFMPVVLDLKIAKVGKTPVPIFVVAASEIDTTPEGEEPVHWLLYTTFPVASAEQAHEVVTAYAMRWRIEQFHNVWKTGACRVEDTQLRDVDHIMRWARILAAVAVRILRLTYLGRKTPDVPATVELRPVEVRAVIMLRKPKGVPRNQIPTLATVVQWLAELGGYTGKSSGGPPGARVIARGLARIESIVEVLVGGHEM